jgi:hypothetical protein
VLLIKVPEKEGKKWKRKGKKKEKENEKERRNRRGRFKQMPNPIDLGILLTM